MGLSTLSRESCSALQRISRIHIFKNDENTLSPELPYTDNNQGYSQLFQNSDIITTQVKTNYTNVIPTVIDCEGNETVIPCEKKSNNTDLKDSRDCFIYNLNN